MSVALKKVKAEPSTERRSSARSAPGFHSRKGELRVEGLTKAELVKEYSDQVKFIAKKIAFNLPGNVDVDDLISVGYIGLMDAADRFDPERGFKFRTYAEFRIRGAILDELRSQDFVPRNVRDNADLINESREKLERKNGHSPTENEVCKDLGMELNRYQTLRQRVSSVAVLNLDDQPHIVDEITSVFVRTPFNEACHSQVGDEIEKLLSVLPDNEKMVLKFYYLRELNLRQISQIMQISESRVSQLHIKAILGLKQMIKEKKISPPEMFLSLLDLE